MVGVARNGRKDRRALLIQSGMDHFSRFGYRDVSVEDIARGCGLSVGTFYNHFAGKEEFYDAILVVMSQEGIRKARNVISRLRSPVNRLRVLYQYIVLGIRRYPVLRGVLARDPRFLYPGFDAAGGAVGSLRTEMEEMVAEIIRDGSRRGIFRPGLYEDVNRLVISLFEVVLINLDAADVDILARDVLVLLQRGLRRAIRIPRPDELRDRRHLPAREDGAPDTEDVWSGV